MITGERRTKLLKLARLASFIEDLPHDRFHMPNWCSADATATSCGTAGCACGWAATLYRDDWTFASDRYGRSPVLKTSDGYGDSCADFGIYFGISEDEAYAITLNLDGDASDAGLSSYCAEYGLCCLEEITPRHAADRIRRVLHRIDPTIVPEADGQKPQVPVLETTQ